jgi:probable phosphoglycerate mutase
VRATGRALVGDDRLIVPGRLAHIYVSPRRRARRTLELLELNLAEGLPWDTQEKEKKTTKKKKEEEKEEEEKEEEGKGTGAEEKKTKDHDDEDDNSNSGGGGALLAHACEGPRCPARVEVTPAVREWDYGAYEGLTSSRIRALRAERFPELPRWDIWADGCEGGEAPADVAKRLDAVIADIRARWHRPALDAAKAGAQDVPLGDVMVVAHGHVLRALALRWCGRGLDTGPAFLMEAGGVGILR